MYNIQKAVSRLDFAPKLSEIEITDIKNGIGVFTPKAEKKVSFASLKTALKKAGYTLASAKITVSGTFGRDDSGWWIAAGGSGQRFSLEGEPSGFVPETRGEISGDWKTVGDNQASRELITPLKKPAQSVGEVPIKTESVELASGEFLGGPGVPVAPIRTTSPGLTVYRGGAVVPRYLYTRQQLGGLQVDRHLLLLSFSYTPTPTIQLEGEVPFARTSFKEGGRASGGEGLGNLTLWVKYRCFRRVEEWGDRQAALRFGLELPTGKKEGPGEGRLSAPAFVRQQLTPISGGLSPHVDAAYSQAKGRFIFGGNVEGIVRSERDGFRMGHEVRVNTDFEYVLFPRQYDRPGGEVFAILETNFIRRGTGHVDGAAVPGSRSTEYHLSPGLQFAVHPRFVIEGSLQLPVIRNAGAQALRTERSLLLGVRLLY